MSLDEVRLSVIVPTIGRPGPGGLAGTLASILLAVPAPGDEVLIVDDSGGRGVDVEQAAQDSGLASVCRLVVIRPARHLGGWGHPARNLAMREASGTHVLSIDDDDEYEPRALARIRVLLSSSPDALHVWRMVARGGETKWADEQLRQGNVGTPMFGVSRETAGRWGHRYEGDYDYALTSAMSATGGVVWHPDALVRCG